MCLKHLVIFLVSVSVAFAVTCHQSCTPGTYDCPTYPQQCRDVYCTYMRSVYLYQGNYTKTKLACSNEALLQPDTYNPAFTTLNTCTRIVYNGVEYTMKICDNADYCSDDCVTVQKKQQPGYVTCRQSCTPADSNCPSNNQLPCSDYYCTYMKKVYQNNYTETKQTCSNIARLQPGQNNPTFTAINQCTRNTYFGIEYTMKICNTDYCSDTCDLNQNPTPSPSSANYGMISISLLVILMMFNLLTF